MGAAEATSGSISYQWANTRANNLGRSESGHQSTRVLRLCQLAASSASSSLELSLCVAPAISALVSCCSRVPIPAGEVRAKWPTLAGSLFCVADDCYFHSLTLHGASSFLLLTVDVFWHRGTPKEPTEPAHCQVDQCSSRQFALASTGSRRGPN